MVLELVIGYRSELFEGDLWWCGAGEERGEDGGMCG